MMVISQIGRCLILVVLAFLVVPTAPAGDASRLALAWGGEGNGSTTPSPSEAGSERPRRAIPATLGWGPPLRMVDRPKHTPPLRGPGEWASRYRLGPGDVLSLALYGQPNTRKTAVEIGPDGTVSFLQARRVRAKGRTVPELRDAMRGLLAEYYEDPKVLVTPVALKSKRYTLLGKVRKSGSYPLERPTTLLEALAQGGGILIGISRLGVGELADLRRSFVVRKGDKLAIDMERLYAQGDLSQNVFLEPGDYIYIASNVQRHCYVLGAVGTPGEVSLDTPLTVTGAIAASKGFAEKAWKKRVLLVSGNLSAPRTGVIDLRAILSGKAQDVGVQPGDIVFVSERPWAFAEDILDSAIRAFVQGSAAAAFETDTSISVGR